jgi:hypothetical protein
MNSTFVKSRDLPTFIVGIFLRSSFCHFPKWSSGDIHVDAVLFAAIMM